MKALGVFNVAVLLCVATAAGCGSPGVTPGNGFAPPASIRQAAISPPSADAHGHHKKLAGKYDGTIEWSEGGVTYSGTLETILRFNFKNIRGPFRMTIGSQTKHLRFYGRIRSKTPEKALIAFAIYNKAGNYATGNGNIANGVFFGRAKTIAGPSLTLQFTVTKS